MYTKKWQLPLCVYSVGESKEKSDPAGVILNVMDGLHRLPFTYFQLLLYSKYNLNDINVSDQKPGPDLRSVTYCT